MEVASCVVHVSHLIIFDLITSFFLVHGKDFRRTLNWRFRLAIVSGTEVATEGAL